MDNLIDGLYGLHSTLVSKAQQELKSTQTMESDTRQLSQICILPKSVLRKIFLYLDYLTDIPAILETCILFNKIVKSRVFQMKLHRPLTIVVAPSKINLDPPNAQPSNLEEAVNSLKGFIKINSFLASKIKNQDRKIEELTNTISSVNEQLTKQKQMNRNLINEVSSFQSELERAVQNEQNSRKELETTNQNYKDQIEELDNQISDINNERETLKGHKHMLANEVSRLRKEYAESLKELRNFRIIVMKMRAYFDALEQAYN